jgi:NAD-dependent deacetylase
MKRRGDPLRSMEELGARLQDGGRITVLTGAGISAESGIRTFRDAGGLWEEHPLEDVATPEGFERDPALVHRFYNARRRQVGEVSPNAAHRALAEAEARLGGRFTLITQNVDDLHERAGSRRLLHMHGTILHARCADCQSVVDWRGDLTVTDRCRRCAGPLRPHVVWFGELPFYMEREIPLALQAEVFISIGTSGTVYPAAGFVAAARANDALTVEVNLERSANASLFDLSLFGKATERVPELVAWLVRRESSKL